jgi:hypothetical protein
MSAELLLQSANLVLSGGVLLYAIRVEHRFTALETAMQIVMKVLELKMGGRRSSDV